MHSVYSAIEEVSPRLRRKIGPHLTPYAGPAGKLLPVRLVSRGNRVTLHAGGETITFEGDLVRLDGDGVLRSRVTQQRCGALVVLNHAVQTPSGGRLREVTWLAGQWSPGCGRAVASTHLQDSFLFLRKGSISFLFSLDFPYSRIDEQGVRYPPHETLSPGQTWTGHSLSIGACRLTGREVGRFDVAEIEAASAYVELRFPPRFDRPMITSACITNRLTDCREGRIFYSMLDNPTLSLSPERLEEDIRLMSAIGVEWFQVFEGMFDWPNDDRPGRALRRLTGLGHRLGVRLGDYIHPGELYCPHYNYEHRRVDRPDWRVLDAKGNPRQLCLAQPDCFAMLRDAVLAHNRKYRQQFICLDMYSLEPCHATTHGHPAGDVYRQVRNLIRLMDDLSALSPSFLVWTNSGNWIELAPKLVWHNPNVYLSDPHVRGYVPSLSQHKILGDNRREQMVSVHENYFVPYRAFCNCEYYAFPDSRIPDIKVFEYSLLQSLAVTPNLCPAETRTFLNRSPAATRDDCIRFLRRWTDFLRANFDAWKNTLRVGDAPGVGAAEAYAHIRDEGDRGFLCLVNQNPFPRTLKLALNASLGLTRGRQFVLTEIYPDAGDRPIAEQPLPAAAWGDELTLDLPAHSVRYLKIAPGSLTKGLTVCGPHTAVVRRGRGWRVTLRAPQGKMVRLGLVLPPATTVAAVRAAQVPTVPMYTFPASARIAAVAGNVAWVEVTMPRSPAPRELTAWTLEPGGRKVSLPRLPECGFLGGLVHQAFSENLDVWLDIDPVAGRSGKRMTHLHPPPIPTDRSGARTRIKPMPRQTFTAEFDLPFIETFPMRPGWDDDCVVELSFADPGRVAALAATLNGRVIEVQKYVYPGKPAWHSFYVRLTGHTRPGKQVLAVTVDWTPHG